MGRPSDLVGLNEISRENRVLRDLVEGLLSGRGEPGDAERWARHLGYDAGRDHHAVCVRLEVPAAAADEGRATASAGSKRSPAWTLTATGTG